MRTWGKKEGLTAFFILFTGQTLSTIGSAITSFGVSIWLFQQTEQATALTFASAAYLGPLLLVQPLAGTFVDRGNRKRIMLGVDTLAGLSTLTMLLLFQAGALLPWHIYLLNIVNGAVNAFQWPAFQASVTLMVDKEHYSRTSGFMQMGSPLSNMIAPAAAAAMLAVTGFESLLLLDLVTFVIAFVTLVMVVIPQPPASAETSTKPTFLQSTKEGFTYIFERPSLLGFLLLIMGLNLGTIFGVSVLVPMILATPGADEAVLGTARAIAAAGGVTGGLLLGIWGGPDEKMRFLLLAAGVSALAGVGYAIASGVVGWAVMGFISQFCSTFGSASMIVIWQRKIPPNLQGRVFAVQGLFVGLMVPIVTVIAGPLADHVFEPSMLSGGLLSQAFGWLVGTEPGSGMSLMTLLGNMVSLTALALGYSSTRIRHIETLVPDYDAVPA